MPSLSYVLYDTAQFGTSGNVDHQLFQVPQGGDATHDESFTNARGGGTLPNDESFEVNRIGIVTDYEVVEADLPALYIDSFVEVRVGDRTVLKAPLALFAMRSAYGGHFAQAAAANQSLIGLVGDGFKLDTPINLPGGQSFKVKVHQGTAVAAADSSIKVCLFGTLTMP